MQINIADLRSMMREDALGLLVGVLLMLTGLLAVAMVSVLRLSYGRMPMADGAPGIAIGRFILSPTSI